METRLCCSTISPLDVSLASPADCDSPVRAASSRWELQVDVQLNFCSFLVCGPPERSRTNGSDLGPSPSSRCPADGAAPAAYKHPEVSRVRSTAVRRKCFTWSFPSDGEKFGVGEEQTRQASNGERLKSADSRPTSSLRYLFCLDL